MKQTVKEAMQDAWRKYRNDDIGVIMKPSENFEKGFIAGVEWQAKCAWTRISERLPEDGEEVLVLSRMNRSGKYFVTEDCYDKRRWSADTLAHYKRIAWMPIPSFDKILETNKG